MVNLINDDLDPSSSDNESDKETFLNQKKIIISQQKLVMLLVASILSIKVMKRMIKHYQLKILFMKLNRIWVTELMITKRKVNGKFT